MDMAFKGMAQINKKDLWTIPNIITYFRILCIPAFVTLMALAGVRNNTTLLYWGAGVFAVATASDLVDGYIARKFNMTSGIGMVLDPFADKLMQVSVLLCLCLCTGLTPLGQATSKFFEVDGGWYVHYAFVIAIMFKELIMILASPFIMKAGAKIQANWWGKISSAIICIGVILCFFHPYIYFVDWGVLGLGITLSYVALGIYARDVFRQIKLIKEGKMERVTDESVKYTSSDNMHVIRPMEDTAVVESTDGVEIEATEDNQ
jgi:cardiolipin synthase